MGDVAVIGIPDAEWGEQVKAIVELVDGVAPSEELAEELVAYCQERMGRYKCPRTVDFREELPRPTVASSTSASSARSTGLTQSARCDAGRHRRGGRAKHGFGFGEDQELLRSTSGVSSASISPWVTCDVPWKSPTCSTRRSGGRGLTRLDGDARPG